MATGDFSLSASEPLYGTLRLAPPVSYLSLNTLGVQIPILIPNDSPGHCTWLLRTRAWLGMWKALDIAKIAIPDSRPDHYNAELDRDSTPILPVFLIS